MVNLWESKADGLYRVVWVDYDATEAAQFAVTLRDGLTFEEAGALTESLAETIEWREQAEEYVREYGASEFLRAA